MADEVVSYAFMQKKLEGAFVQPKGEENQYILLDIPLPEAPVEPPAAEEEGVVMASITREEHDAKLATLEAKFDGALGRMEAILNGVSSSVSGLKDDLRETRGEFREARRHSTQVALAIAAGIISILALMFQIKGDLPKSSPQAPASQASAEGLAPPQVVRIEVQAIAPAPSTASDSKKK